METHTMLEFTPFEHACLETNTMLGFTLFECACFWPLRGKHTMLPEQFFC